MTSQNKSSGDTYYKYLAFFRVYLAFHIIKKYILYFPVLDYVYGPSSLVGLTTDPILNFLNIDNHSIMMIMTLLLSAALLMLLGIGKNFTVLLVFLLLEIIQRMNGYLLNGGDNFLKFIFLYMIFTNSFTRFSFFKNSSICRPGSISELLHKLGVLAIKLHLCLIYFVSGFFKINSKVWFHGVATYYTLNLERFSGSSLNKLLTQNGWIVTLSTYLVMLWEIFFPALIWNKNTKYIVLSIGVLMHIGIYFLMMIHDFEIVFIATYGLFISDETWDKIGKKILHYKSKIPFLDRFNFKSMQEAP